MSGGGGGVGYVSFFVFSSHLTQESHLAGGRTPGLSVPERKDAHRHGLIIRLKKRDLSKKDLAGEKREVKARMRSFFLLVNTAAVSVEL